MPQGEGRAQYGRSAGSPERIGSAPSREGLHFGANPGSGAATERRAFAALFLLPEYRWSWAVRKFPETKGYRDEQETTRHMQIIVRDNNVDQALRALKKKLQREGVYREMKLRRHYEKPSEKRARERAAAVRRARKMERKRMERDGIK
jgi:small subunit ribosomal protein S21